MHRGTSGSRSPRTGEAFRYNRTMSSGNGWRASGFGLVLVMAATAGCTGLNPEFAADRDTEGGSATQTAGTEGSRTASASQGPASDSDSASGSESASDSEPATGGHGTSGTSGTSGTDSDETGVIADCPNSKPCIVPPVGWTGPIRPPSSVGDPKGCPAGDRLLGVWGHDPEPSCECSTGQYSDCLFTVLSYSDAVCTQGQNILVDHEPAGCIELDNAQEMLSYAILTPFAQASCTAETIVQPNPSPVCAIGSVQACGQSGEGFCAPDKACIYQTGEHACPDDGIGWTLEKVYLDEVTCDCAEEVTAICTAVASFHAEGICGGEETPMAGDCDAPDGEVPTSISVEGVVSGATVDCAAGVPVAGKQVTVCCR